MTPAPKKISFDRTISLGHVISLIGFILMTFMQWNLLDKRIVVIEEAQKFTRERDASQHERDNAQDQASKDKFQEVRDALADLRRSVEKVADKVGAK